MPDTINIASDTTTQQNGRPSEGRIRKGQIDWVPGISKATEFRLWSFKFKAGAYSNIPTSRRKFTAMMRSVGGHG